MHMHMQTYTLQKHYGHNVIIFNTLIIQDMLFPWQTDQVNSGESYDPLLMSPWYQYTSISVDEGLKKDF